MRLFQAQCDIAILTGAQAWENYCTALHLAQATRIALARHKWHFIARLSLDRYFDCIERRMELANERDAA
jgi:hypothetical protein